MAGQPKTRKALVKLNALGPETIEEMLSDGMTLEDVTKTLDVPKGALNKWLDQPEQQGLYARARAKAAHNLAEQAIAIADGADSDGDVARDRLRVDTRKWIASRWNASAYADQKNAQVIVNVGDLHLSALRNRTIDVNDVHEVDTIESSSSPSLEE